MKILYIAPKIPIPIDEGGKIVIQGEVKYLSKLGHKIDFVAYHRKNSPIKDFSEIEKYARIFLLDVDTRNKIFKAMLNIFSRVPYNISKYISQQLRNFINEYLKENQPDVVIVANLHMGYIIDEIRKVSNVKVILRQHNVEGQLMKRFFDKQKNLFLRYYAKMQFLKFLSYEPQLCEKFDLVVFITEQDEMILKEMNPNINSVVIQVGIERDNFPKIIRDLNPLTIFHIGSLKWLPNLDSAKYFINAILPIIVKEEPKVKFYLYGGILPENFEMPESVKGNVIQKGYVADLWDEVKDKMLAVVPLRIGSGMRLKIVELMAAGCYIVTTSLGTEGIKIHDNQHLLIADNENDFAEKCLKVLRNHKQYDSLVENAKIFVEKNYSWEGVAIQFEEQIKKLF